MKYILLILISVIAINCQSQWLENYWNNRIASGDNPQIYNETPIISWVFDDGSDEDYTLVYPVCMARNIPATICLVTSTIDTPGVLTREQILEMISDGFEMASHSHTHADLTTISASELSDELRISKDTVIAIQGWCNNLIYPYNSKNDEVIDSTRNVYDYAAGGADLINSYRVFTYEIARRDLNTDDVPAMKAYIDQVVENHGWLILYTHPFDWDSSDTTAFGELIDYADSVGVTQVTMSEAEALFPNDFIE